MSDAGDQKNEDSKFAGLEISALDWEEADYATRQLANLASNASFQRFLKALDPTDNDTPWDQRTARLISLIMEQEEPQFFQTAVNNRPSPESFAIELVSDRNKVASERPIYTGLCDRFIAQLDDDAAFIAESDWVQGADTPRVVANLNSETTTPVMKGTDSNNILKESEE